MKSFSQQILGVLHFSNVGCSLQYIKTNLTFKNNITININASAVIFCLANIRNYIAGSAPLVSKDSEWICNVRPDGSPLCRSRPDMSKIKSLLY